MIRLLNICVIAALVFAAADVYKIKFESIRQAERIAKLRMEVRQAREAIATLRAEWSKLDNPARIEELSTRHLLLKFIDARQFDTLDRLPERPPEPAPPAASDPVDALLEQPADLPTSSVSSAKTSPQRGEVARALARAGEGGAVVDQAEPPHPDPLPQSASKTRVDALIGERQAPTCLDYKHQPSNSTQTCSR